MPDAEESDGTEQTPVPHPAERPSGWTQLMPEAGGGFNAAPASLGSPRSQGEPAPKAPRRATWVETGHTQWHQIASDDGVALSEQYNALSDMGGLTVIDGVALHQSLPAARPQAAPVPLVVALLD